MVYAQLIHVWNMKNNTTLKAFLALFLLTLIWGYNWVVMKLAVQAAGPFQFAAIRTFFGAIMLFIVLYLSKRPLALKEFPTMLALGLLQTCGFTGLLIWALMTGGAGKTAVLSYTMPFWVMLLAWPMLGEKVQGWQWLAVMFALFGIVLIFDPLHMKGDVVSMLMALGSGISWAISAIVSKKLHQRRPDLDLLNITAWPTLLGSLPLIVVALLVPMQTIDWSQTFVLTIIYSVFLSGSLAWVLWTYALQRLQAGVASMASMLAPVIGVVAAWLQLGERPSQLELVGMLFIALALVVISAITIHRHQQVAIAQGQE
jgi:drug/metabolite transporter (DMT)-like permease